MARQYHPLRFRMDAIPWETLEKYIRHFRGRILVDDSNEIDAGHIVASLASTPQNMVVVIDYMQLLDQRRNDPDLAYQLVPLKRIGGDRRLTVVCLSQNDRSYDSALRPCPGLEDVRLPSPVDLDPFDRARFLHRGRMLLEIPDSSLAPT